MTANDQSAIRPWVDQVMSRANSKGKTVQELAVAGVDALTEFIKECGLPTRLGELRMNGVLTENTLRAIADSCNLIQTGQALVSREEIPDVLRGVL